MKVKLAVVAFAVSAAAMVGVGGLTSAGAALPRAESWANVCERVGGVTANSTTTLNCVTDPAPLSERGKRALARVCTQARGSFDAEISVGSCFIIPFVWDQACARAGGVVVNSSSTLNCAKESPAVFNARSKRALTNVCTSIGGIVDIENSVVACVWNVVT